MGNEFAQVREWDETRQQDWDLLAYPLHDGFHRFMARLNRLYLDHPALWAGDYDREGFQWIDCHQEEKCVYAFERRGGGERLAAVFNFSSREQAFLLKLDGAKALRPLLDSDPSRDHGPSEAFALPPEGARLDLPPYSGFYFLVL